MIGAQFDLPDDQLQARKRIIVSTEEIDGDIYEIAEGGGK